MNEDTTTVVDAITPKGDHIVGIGDLRVVLVEEERAWYAQGLELDYIAQGSTIDEAKKNFEHGLHVTIRENLQMHGTIKPLLVQAPDSVWSDWLDPSARTKRFYYIAFHENSDEQEDSVLKDVSGILPFQGIDFLQAVPNG